MKWFRSRAVVLAAAGLAVGASLAALHPVTVRAGRVGEFFRGSLASWLTNTEAGSKVESALYRLMALPTGDVLYPRTPAEARPAITELLKANANDGALYSLRALQDEQALDFAAAEADWKAWAEHDPDRGQGEIDLADFYARRLKPREEIAALMVVGEGPAAADEALTAPEQQRSWKAFARILHVAKQDALGAEVADATWQAWIRRYPAEPAVYSRYFDALIAEKRYEDADALLKRYRDAFPKDEVFPIEAEASLAQHRESVAAGLAVYDKAFDPLWPAELIQSYFNLLKQTHSLSAFVDRMRARLVANADDEDAATRLFYAYQQQGRMDAAKQVLADFRHNREARGVAWKAQELYTFGTMLEGVQAYPEAARYFYALYSSEGMADAQSRALAGIVSILLAAPEQPVRVGAGDLSMYRDIATMDDGPGYLNGILSLLLNTTDPAGEYATEDRLASPYFHRAAAARLLAQLDARFPGAAESESLHAKLISAYAVYGEDDAVIRAGNAFLAKFPKGADRVDVAMEMADACARTHRTDEEFAIYDRLLRELAARAGGVPLGDGSARYSKAVGDETRGQPTAAVGATEFSTNGGAVQIRSARSAQYEQVLDRYLSRLIAMRQLPRALTVLRGEVEHDPDDPGIYEKLAKFLDQNHLGEHEAEVYQRAIQHFNETGWYAKLARLYLRQKRNADYESLTEQVAKIFSGTELESYFAAAPAPGAALSLEVNLYAHKRFPHDLRFTQNLLSLYRERPTRDMAAWRALLAAHWFDDATLRNEFFESLAESGELDSALTTLREQNPQIAGGDWRGLVGRNPAAAQFVVEADVWQSHFEGSAPAARALADAYPANAELGDEAASLYRSLAYFDPQGTDRAAGVEKRLIEAEPGNLDRLARIGDIYADRNRFADAAPYWLRMAEAHPGDADGYLQSATIFWDYFDFDNAVAQLEKARRKLGEPALYSYEEGAIYEGKRDYAKAIAEYVRGAVTDSESRGRLIELATRPAYAQMVNAAVEPISAKADPSQDEISLLVDVLSAQHRKSELTSALNGMLDRLDSFDALAFVAQQAGQQSLVNVQEHALKREISITADPARRISLRYDLAHFYETNGERSAADAAMDAVYRENPKILGVVRATVDYDWTHERKPQAIAALQEAAGSAYPGLARQFDFEAARKLTETGQYGQARSVLDELLAVSPFDAGYVEAAAETYGKAGDRAGLRDFYQKQIAALKGADVPDKQAKLAQLRRGLIPALTDLNDSAGAVDQYIQLMDAYPDDGALTSEAALYAAGHGEQARLVGFYEKAVADSPRDSRWPVVLARMETALENYPAAIDAYGKAIVIRPDRVDLYTARAALDEKLQRYDAAVADYQKLYSLSYNDPQWMEKVAEDRARQGKQDLAVAALKTALIDGKPEKAQNYFAVAEKLEGWNMLEAAAGFAEKGVELAGDDLLADGANHAGGVTYARILTRQRKASEAYAKLSDALESAGKMPGVTATLKQVEEKGIAAVTNDQWREQRREVRLEAGRQGFAAAVRAMAATANEYYTPEETAGFAEFLRVKSMPASREDRMQFYVPAAQAAGLAALEADLDWENATSNAAGSGPRLTAWIALERRRLLLDDAASRLQGYAPSVAAEYRGGVFTQAANLFHDAGDGAGELRALDQIAGLSERNGELRQRYFGLLLQQQPERLVTLAGSGSDEARDAATQFAVLHAGIGLALRAVRARGDGLAPVWTSSYMGLAGLYRHQLDSPTGEAFVSALGNGTIGERVAGSVDRTQRLAGDVWFYYGARYGEFLDLSHSPGAQDYLSASLERNPESATPYEELAAWYGERGNRDRAIAEYRLALQLEPNDARVHDKIALLLWDEGKKENALNEWKTAVGLLAKAMDLRNAPEGFWPDFGDVMEHVGKRGQLGAVRAQVDAMLRTYIGRNGAYMAEPLLKAVYVADGSSDDATNWMLSLATVSNPPDAVLNAVVNAQWIPDAQRPRVYAAVVDVVRKSSDASEGLARREAENRLRQVRARWIESLMKAGDFAAAKAGLDAVSDDDRKAHADLWEPIVMKLAAHEGTLAAMMEQWRKDPANAPAAELLRSAAAGLDAASKDLVLGFVYQRAMDGGDLSATNFLGLAQIRIRDGDITGAVALLRRMVLVSADEYTDLDSAASLLERTGRDVEALPFLEQLASGVPWEAKYHLRLDEARVKAGQQKDVALGDLAKLASDEMAPYAVRVSAARMLREGGHPAGNLGSGELNLLAGGRVNAEAARKTFFFAARMAAAQASAQDRIALLKEAVALRPDADEARIALVEAAIAAKDAHLAVNAATPLIGRAPYVYEGEFANGSDGGNSGVSAWSAGLAASLNQLPAQRRARILAGVADSYVTIGDLNEALQRYRQASHLEPNAAGKKTLKAKMSELSERMARRAENLRRAPLIHKAVDQNHAVRPRVVTPVDGRAS